MLIEDREFTQDTFERTDWHEKAVYRFCSFDDIELMANGLEGALMWSSLTAVDWYSGLISTATIVNTKFERCVFRGCTFADCALVNCSFAQCRFVTDNLGSTCSFEDCIVAETTFDRCEYVLTSLGQTPRPVFVNTRWYGCTQTACSGLEGQF